MSASSASMGLIPAWAGKTANNDSYNASDMAHPRVGGENDETPLEAVSAAGSSPLTRGKPTRATWQGAHPGLIPAHAGKTI